MALEEAVGGEQLTTAAFRRLLAAAGENDAARVEVLLALAERQVCVVMEPGAGRSRCLTNGDGESAMPVFTGTDLQTEVAQRFGWVDAAGACEARVLRGKEAFHMALLQDVEFIVVDITFEHAAEFSREEIEAALAVPRQRAATAAQQGKARQAVEQVREAVRRSTRPPGGPQGFSPEAKVPPAPRVPAATEAQPARKLRERRPAQVVELAELDDPFASRRKRKERARAEAAAARTNAGRAPVPPPTAAQVPVPPPTAAQVPVPPPIAAQVPVPPPTAAQVPVPPPAASPLGPSTPTGDAAGYDFGAPRADVAAAPDAMPALPELDAAPGAPPHAPPREHASPTDPGVPAFDNAPPAFGEAAPPAMPALPDDNAAPPAFGAPTDAGPPAFGAPPDVGPPAFGTPTDAGPPAFGAPNAVDQGAPAYGQSAPGYGQAAPSWNEPFGGAGAQAHPEALEAAALVTQVARESGDADAVDAAAEVANLLKQTARGDDDEAPAVSGAASALARAFTAQTADGKTTLGAGPAAPSATGAAAGDEDALGEVVPESVVTAGVKSAARTLIGMFKKGEVVAADAAEPEAAEEADEGMRESEPEPEGLRAPEAPLEDEVLEALSSALGPYLEVEWACQCADEGELPVLGVRVDPSFDQRVDEIEATLAKAARARGVDATVVVLTDPQVMRQARKVGTVFHPFRRKPKPRG